MIRGKQEKLYRCSKCGNEFSNLDVPGNCSNCFACTGCEIYTCPTCGEEVVIRPMKQMNQGSSSK